MTVDLLAAMQSFVRVYEAGSFTAGARTLRVSQPTASKMVAQLEDHLGVRLLLRSTQGLTPTEAGQAFYEHALRTLEEADLAMRAATSDAENLSGRIRVSGTVTFVRQHIIPRLPEFFAQYPRIEIDFLLEDRNIGLIEEGVDVALRMGRLASSGLTARKIGQCRRIVVASATYLAEKGSPDSPEDLPAHPAVVLSLGEGGERVAFAKASKSKDIVLRPRLRVTSAEGVRAAVLAGVGLAVATEWIFDQELLDGTVQEVLKDWTLPPLDLWVVLPAGRRTAPKTRAFVSFVEEQLLRTRFSVRANRSV
jgi:DNA-binding transcriptional LysR family regulator